MDFYKAICGLQGSYKCLLKISEHKAQMIFQVFKFVSKEMRPHVNWKIHVF